MNSLVTLAGGGGEGYSDFICVLDVGGGGV